MCSDPVFLIANSARTVYQGTSSAGRIYDLFTACAVGEVMFVTRSSVIARLVPPDEVGEGAEEKAVLCKRREERDGAPDRSDWENVLPDFKLRPYDV